MVATKYSESDHELYSYLESNYQLFENWSCLVALSEDRDAIFVFALNADGTPDRDPPHLNWTLVSAPESEFVDDVNHVFGTAFRWESFAGR